MAEKAEAIEKASQVGDSAVIQDWNCGEGVSIHIVVDQDRATRLGLM